MARLNLTIDKNFAKVLSIFKKRYPLLKEVDIIKMAVAGYYTDHYSEFAPYQDQTEDNPKNAPKAQPKEKTNSESLSSEDQAKQVSIKKIAKSQVETPAQSSSRSISDKKLVGLNDLFASL